MTSKEFNGIWLEGFLTPLNLDNMQNCRPDYGANYNHLTDVKEQFMINLKDVKDLNEIGW